MIDEEVAAVVLAIVVVAGIIASVYFFFGEEVIEPFSELAILGPNKKLADYPTEVCVNESINLYLYIGNHEGKSMYYKVLVKLGDCNTQINETIPANASVIAQYERILLNGEKWVTPIALKLSKPGQNLRLIFELWIYDVKNHTFKYHGRWNQLWLNVTAFS